MSHISGNVSRVLSNPRSYWSRVLAAIEFGEKGQAYKADRLLETLRYNDNVDGHLFSFFNSLIGKIAANDTSFRHVNIPSDYNRGLGGPLHPPFRTIRENAKLPKPYPFGLALPHIIGNGNDFRYIEEYANWRSSTVPTLQIDIVYPYENGEALAGLIKSIEEQVYNGRVRLHLFGESAPDGPALAKVEIVHHPVAFLSAVANERLLKISADTQMLLFVSGFVELEPMTLARMAHIGQISDHVVQPLVEPAVAADATLFTTGAYQEMHNRRYPFRDIMGLNFALTSTMYREAGAFFDTRFESSYHAARELSFRLYNRGCYFQPLPTRSIRKSPAVSYSTRDMLLYTQLCPNHWDRQADGIYEVPKVSIYIPAYKAGKYIRRAIDSVLAQDMQDLEVCIADDGSRDDTLEVLERHYGNEARVRWSTAMNGGIGFASNRAIAMARGIYIGQLDSDDCLKPGAVRRLSDFLDDNAEVACCYASCERVDADGNHIKNEYSWPVFSREKMMITSIVHHFRMFRKLDWERTEKFREDIVNAVDYDIFLKLSEVGKMHHIDEIFYQRRWHGENTSNVNETFQTANTHRVQREALTRVGLANFWDLAVENPQEPRRVSYHRREGCRLVMFWPYYRANSYQRLLYAPQAGELEFCPATIDAALQMINGSERPQDNIFHLHWLNFLFKEDMSEEDAGCVADDFLAKLEAFKAKGGGFVWTIHNIISHDAVHQDVEIRLSTRLAELADILHFHSQGSVTEVEDIFPIPRDKVRIARHGHYIGAYPDLVPQRVARLYLGLAPMDDVILFNGQVRQYKGIDTLIEAFRTILPERPQALLLIAGAAREDPLQGLVTPLTTYELSRIRFVDRYVDDAELQVFLRAADFAVYPYRNILTSGSLMLALSFGLPAVVTEVAMTRDVMGKGEAGLVYDGSVQMLQEAMIDMLARKDDGRLQDMAQEAERVARACPWEPLFPCVA
jgi:glycosyltransferase involved in cell wall biosynthesis